MRNQKVEKETLERGRETENEKREMRNEKRETKNLFISRSLAEESPIRNFTKENNIQLFPESLIEFTPVQFNTIPEADWIFFYSKNGVHFFFERLAQLGLKAKAKIATMGLGTLNALKTHGKSADFAGNGHPQQVADAFGVLAKDQKVLFPRAMQSQKSVQSLLKGQIEILDLVVYANHARTNFQLPELDYLLFTSPLNVQAYFERYALKSDQKIFAIGKTTAKELYELGFSDVLIADQPSEKALVELVRENL